MVDWDEFPKSTFYHQEHRKRQMNQLTFDNIRSNPSVPKIDISRLRRQTIRIYNHLLAGPLWTNQLVGMAKQYNARLKEIREMLAEYSWTVDMTLRGKDGNNRYELRPLAGSKYQAHLMQKQKSAKALRHEDI
jgi:hypothetical protein